MAPTLGSSLPLLLLSAVFLLLLVVGDSHAAEIRDKRSADGSDYSNLKDKRPFCNAFTGCGRKRSAAPVVGGKGGGGADYENNGFSADSRAELDELARHVLAQARLWEQLQHKVELLKSLASGYPDSSGNTLETLPYRRRKRSSPQHKAHHQKKAAHQSDKANKRAVDESIDVKGTKDFRDESEQEKSATS